MRLRFVCAALKEGAVNCFTARHEYPSVFRMRTVPYWHAPPSDLQCDARHPVARPLHFRADMWPTERRVPCIFSHPKRTAPFPLAGTWNCRCTSTIVGYVHVMHYWPTVPGRNLARGKLFALTAARRTGCKNNVEGSVSYRSKGLVRMQHCMCVCIR